MIPAYAAASDTSVWKIWRSNLHNSLINTRITRLGLHQKLTDKLFIPCKYIGSKRFWILFNNAIYLLEFFKVDHRKDRTKYLLLHYRVSGFHILYYCRSNIPGSGIGCAPYHDLTAIHKRGKPVNTFRTDDSCKVITFLRIVTIKQPDL